MVRQRLRTEGEAELRDQVRPVTDADIGLRVLVEPKQENGNTKPIVKIVAIHGLGAHPDETWCKNRGTAEEPEWVNWLETGDMLPAALSNTCVMRYGYQSAWFGKDKIKQTPRTVAQKLLLALDRDRMENGPAPLIFIAHSFGGLVVLKALCNAQRNWPGIFKSTAGIVFFGTPFRGADGMSQSEMIEAASREYAREDIEKDPLHILDPGNEILKDLVDQFCEMWSTSHQPPITCFYELQASEIGAVVGKQRRKAFAVNEQSGCLDILGSIKKYPLSKNHFNMNKFASPGEEDFLLVKDVVKEMVLYARKMPLSAVRLTEDQSAFLESISTTNPKFSESERNALAGTMLWLTSHITYQRWIQQKLHGFFHIFGKPGCGKTTISIFLAEKMKELGHTVCYFSFNDDDGQKSVGAVYTSFLTQLLDKKPVLYNLVLPAYKEMDPSNGLSPQQIRSLFKSCATSSLHGRFIFVIDGLDECDSSRNYLLEDCIEMLSLSQFIGFVALSRPEHDILQCLKESLKLNLDGEEGLTKDIEKFIDAGIDKLLAKRKGLGKLLPEIKSSLVDRADGMFLLVRLLLEELGTLVPANPRSIRLALKSLPDSLSEAYDKMLMRIPAKNHNWAKKVLCWVLYSLRPLSIPELATALAVDGDTDSMESIVDETSSCDIEDDLNLTFGSLIKVERNTVHITHQSAREFLLQEKHDPPAWYRLDASWANECIAGTCIGYIKLCDLERRFHTPLSQLRKKERKKRLQVEVKSFPLLKYSVQSWPEHMRRLDVEVPLLSLSLSTFLLNDLHRRKWEELYWGLQNSRRTTLLDSPLHICAMVGNKNLLKHLLGMDAMDVTAKTGYEETALHIAASYGTKEVVELLLDENIAVTAQSEERETALHSSIRMGQDILAKTILEKVKDKEVDTMTDRKGWRPLHLAALKGFSGLATSLIARVANVDCPDVQKRTPLHLATLNGHLDVVKSLIKADASVELMDMKGCSALHKAVQRQQREIVAVLLEKGAQPSAVDDQLWTPLHEAASQGDLSMLNALLKSYGSRAVDLEDKKKQTPLQIASIEGAADIAEVLLQRRANPFHRDMNGMDALDLAADNQRKSVVELLLKENELGWEIGKKAKLYQKAAAQGKKQMVEFWLSRKVDIDFQDDDQRTALHHAAMNGRDEIVILLLDQSADPSLKERNGRTPLSSALHSQQERTALFLAEAGNLNLEDGRGKSPLHWTARTDWVEVGSILIEKKADLNAQDRRGRTPLQTSILYNNIAFAEFLIRSQASCDLPDMFGWTASDWAVWGDSEALLKNLEALGPKARGRPERTALARNRIRIGIDQLKCEDWEWYDEDLRLIGQSAFILGEEALAETIFEEYCTQFRAWTCDKCLKRRKMNPKTGVTERNVCKICFDVDICKVCFRRRMTKDFASPRHCQLEHDFLTVDFQSGIPESNLDLLAERLSRWLEEYSISSSRSDSSTRESRAGGG